LKKSTVAKAANIVCMCSSLLVLATISELQATEAYSSLDPTNEKYIIIRFSVVEKENLSVQINPKHFIACEKRKPT
jgi:uncharacterized protein YsxB (DUF464 family)